MYWYRPRPQAPLKFLHMICIIWYYAWTVITWNFKTKWHNSVLQCKSTVLPAWAITCLNGTAQPWGPPQGQYCNSMLEKKMSCHPSICECRVAHTSKIRHDCVFMLKRGRQTSEGTIKADNVKEPPYQYGEFHVNEKDVLPIVFPITQNCLYRED